MKVRLIAKTVGACPELENKSIGEILAFVARVSNPSNQNNHATAANLLKFCLREKHWSVFEHVYLTMEITTSMAIAEQVLRHQFKFQKFSGRYAKLVEFEVYEARRQDEKNRQNSIDDLSDEIKEWFVYTQQLVQGFCLEAYETALNKGIAKEQARMLLPASTRTTMYATGNIRGWLHYLQSRLYPGAQKEHRDIAKECLKILLDQVVELTDTFENYKDLV